MAKKLKIAGQPMMPVDIETETTPSTAVFDAEQSLKLSKAVKAKEKVIPGI